MLLRLPVVLLLGLVSMTTANPARLQYLYTIDPYGVSPKEERLHFLEANLNLVSQAILEGKLCYQIDMHHIPEKDRAYYVVEFNKLGYMVSIDHQYITLSW